MFKSKRIFEIFEHQRSGLQRKQSVGGIRRVLRISRHSNGVQTLFRSRESSAVIFLRNSRALVKLTHGSIFLFNENDDNFSSQIKPK